MSTQTQAKVRATQNFIKGILFNITFALLTYAIFWEISWILMEATMPFTSISIGCAGAILSLYYFGWFGLRKIEVGFRGAPLLFEKRLENSLLFSEGWVWWWPEPIGNIITRDVRKMPFDMPIEGVLTEDGVLTHFDLAMELQAENVVKTFGVEDIRGLLNNISDDILRDIVAKIHSSQITKARVPIMEILRNGTTKENLPKGISDIVDEKEKRELAALELEGVEPYASREWGYRVTKFRITTIRLPDEIQDAKAKIQVESAQRNSELVEAGTLTLIMEKIKEGNPTLTESEVLAAAQAVQGKRTITNVEGSAPAIIKAGLLSGIGKS